MSTLRKIFSRIGKIYNSFMIGLGILLYYSAIIVVSLFVTIFVHDHVKSFIYNEKFLEFIIYFVFMSVIGGIIAITIYNPFYSLWEKTGIYKLKDIITNTRHPLSPHFDKLFGEDAIRHLIKNETFHEYIFKDGTKSTFIKVSESGNWICILGQYLPTDFICGHRKSHLEVYTIDDATIDLSLKGRTMPSKAQKELDTFFEEQKGRINRGSIGSKELFEKVLSESNISITKADLSKIRYSFEKALASRPNAHYSAKKRYKPILQHGRPNSEIFERPLSENEISKTAGAVKKGQVKLEYYMYLNKYKDELCICNAIELLKALPVQKTTDGLDFIFDLLNDIDKVYFFMAVEFLLTLPDSLVEEKIEEHAKKAYEKQDVQRLGGIMYLAREKGYEIRYIQKVKEEQKDIPSIPGFEFNEAHFYGSKEPKPLTRV